MALWYFSSENEIVCWVSVKNCVYIILSSRRQFGPKAKEEVKIIKHQTQSLRLMPHLATVVALTFTSR